MVRSHDPDPSWVSYFDELKLTVDTGIAHGRLGESALGEKLITQALRMEDHANHRGRAFHMFWLARTQLDQNKLDQACHTATTALQPASAVVSARVSGHLKDFYYQLAPYQGEQATLTFEAGLRELLPQISGSPRP